MKIASLFLTLFFVSAAIYASDFDCFSEDQKNIQQALHESKMHLDIEAGSIKKLARSVAGSRLYAFHSRYLNKDMVARVQKKGFATSKTLYHDVIVASKAGYSPKVYFADKKRGIIVMESIDHLWPQERITESFFIKITKPLRAMHEGAPFSQDKNFLAWLDEAEEKMKMAGIPIPSFQEDLIVEYRSIKENLRKNWDCFSSDIRPVHHDINPGNILFDQKKAYLIDFETASQDVFYLDLAETFNFFVPNPEKQNAFLKAYFRKDPTQEQIAKFNLFKALAFLKNGLWLAQIAALTKLPENKEILDFPEFESNIRKGLVDFGNPQEIQNLAISEFRWGIHLLNTPEIKLAKETLLSS